MKIVKYQKKDFVDLARCMDELQDYLVALDPLKLMHRPNDYGKKYVKNQLKEKGITIFLAKEGNKVLGFISGIVEKQTKKDLLEWKLKKIGYILDLFVFKDSRKSNVGRQLMNKMENYFKTKGCEYARTAVFEPNTGTHEFYRKLKYQDRLTTTIKKL